MSGDFDPGMIVHNHDSQKHGRTAIMYLLVVLEWLLRSVPFSGNILNAVNASSFSNMLVAIFTAPGARLA